jgi:hypothetical protein
MRRTIGLVLLAAGAFLLVLAPLLRFQVADRLIAAPADQYAVYRFTAADARYFSTAELEVLTADLDITVTTRGDVTASTDGRVVWDEFVSVSDVTNDVQGISMTTRRSAFDRRTGQALNCCGAHIDRAPVTMSGQIYLFPFDVQRTTYKVFHSITGKAFDARYVGEEVIDGVTVYRFEQTIPATKTRTLTAPGSAIGMEEEDEVEVDRVFDGVYTYWVEPTTGTPVKQEHQRHEVLKTKDGVERSIALDATAVMTPETVQSLIDRAVEGKNQINLLKNTLPLVLLIVGIALLLFGVLLVSLRAR